MDGLDDYDAEQEEKLLDKRWERLITEVRLFRGRNKHADALSQTFKFATDGDAGMLQWLAGNLQETLFDGDDLNAPQRFLLCWILEQIILDDDLARRASGARGAGRSKDGARGLHIAIMVAASAANDAARMEDAWAAVAEEADLGEDMVKRHWSRWGDLAIALCETTREDLAVAMRNRRGPKVG